MRNCGLIESGYSEYDYDYDKLFSSSIESSKLPNEYNCMDLCDLKIEDQGNKPQCVAYAVAKLLEYNYETMNTEETGHEHVDINKQEIYDSRSNNNENNGMTIRDAMHFIKHNKYNIKGYGRLYGIFGMMKALFTNGPVILALPVHDSSRVDFWNGGGYEGGHAVACVGYTKEGFIILNSWGTSYGHFGTSILSFEDFGKIIEAWTAIV